MTQTLKDDRRKPASGHTGSVVVFLHGYGADGSDLLGLADVFAPHLPDTAFRAPDAPEPCVGTPFGRQWFPIPWMDGSSEAAAAASLARSSHMLDAYLDDVLKEDGITSSKLCIFGFSQGAMMALHVAPRRSVPLAGIVACSGRLLAPERLSSEVVSRPPVLLMHGDADPVVPFSDMQRAGEALTAASFETYGHVMTGSGHGIAPDGLSAALGFLHERLAGNPARAGLET